MFYKNLFFSLFFFKRHKIVRYTEGVKQKIEYV